MFRSIFEYLRANARHRRTGRILRMEMVRSFKADHGFDTHITLLLCAGFLIIFSFTVIHQVYYYCHKTCGKF